MIDTSVVKHDVDVFCVAPWLNLDIRQDGEVKPCCVSEYTMGDIKEKSLFDVWNDEPIRKLRESFLYGYNNLNFFENFLIGHFFIP